MSGRISLDLQIGSIRFDDVEPQADLLYGVGAAKTTALTLIFERDDFTCWGCGFRSRKYQKAVAPRPRPGSLDDFVTLCIFCSHCLRVEDVSVMRSGMPVWLPEIAQPRLHDLMRQIYVARISQGETATAARSLLERLMSRRDLAASRAGVNDIDELVALLRQDERPDETLRARLSPLRLLPMDRRIIKEADLEFNQFPQILAYWRSKDGPLGGAPPDYSCPWIEYGMDLLRNT